MAEHAHAGLERLLQAALLVEVQHGSAQGPEECLGAAVHHGGGSAAHHVGHGLAGHGDAHGVGVVQAGVGKHADALAVLAAAPEAKDVLAVGKGLEVTRSQDRQGLSHGDSVAEDRGAVHATAVPGEGRAVVRVSEALHAALVAIVDAGHARKRHLQQHREPQAAHGKAGVTLVQTERRALLIGEGIGVGRVSQHGEEALAVMAAQQVEAREERVARVVLAQLLQACGHLRRADLVAHEGQQRRAQRVVHGAVELGALKVLAQLAVGHLVGGVLPDLAHEGAVRALGNHCGLDVLDKAVGELVGNVQAPAAGAGAQPLAHHAVLPANELVVLRVLLVYVGKVGVAPPAVIGAVLVEEEPIAVGRLVTLPGTRLGVVAVAVEVAGVLAAVVEDAVQHDGDATLSGLAGQGAELLLVAQHGVNAQVVGRVVAVVAGRLKDGVEVDHGHAEVCQVVELLADATQGAAVEVPLQDVPVLALLVGGRRVPVLHQHARGALAVGGQRLLGTLAPVRPAGKAVREDLVDNAVLVPVWLGLARDVDGQLEGGRVAVGKVSLAGGPALAGAVAPGGAVGRGQVKAVPDHARLRRRVAHGVVDVVVLAGPLHGEKFFSPLVGPDAQGGAHGVLSPDVYAQYDGAAQLDGTEGTSVLRS